MGGWESDNIYAFDTYDPMLMPELFFDKEVRAPSALLLLLCRLL